MSDLLRPRVAATPAALEAIRAVTAERGPILLFQSGGCCDGSLPLCFAVGEFRIGSHDVRLGEVDGCPVYVDAHHMRLWEGSRFVLDVAPGEPEGFSLPAGPDRHFVSRPEVDR